jgi:hypothetical protein
LSTFSYIIFFLNSLVCTFDISESCCKRDQPFKLLSASQQTWTAGVASAGSGTEYYFSIKIISPKKIVFDSVWIGNKIFPSFVTRKKAPITGGSFLYQKGDTITVRVSALTKRPGKEVIAKPFIKCKGAASIGYLINGKRRYICVEKITQQPSVNLP